MGATFRPGSIGTSLDWQIWNILKTQNSFEELKAVVPGDLPMRGLRPFFTVTPNLNSETLI